MNGSGQSRGSVTAVRDRTRVMLVTRIRLTPNTDNITARLVVLSASLSPSFFLHSRTELSGLALNSAAREALVKHASEHTCHTVVSREQEKNGRSSRLLAKTSRRSYTVPNGGGDKCLACLSGFELHSALGESIEGERRLRKESKSIGNRECELRLPDLHLKEQGSELSARSELFERSNKSGGITRD